MRELRFTFRGEEYRVNEEGHISANGIGQFSKEWVFLGGSCHHWCNSVSLPLAVAFENPKLLNGCLGWDRDHGTVRRWGGLYHGKLARIERAHVIEVVDE